MSIVVQKNRLANIRRELAERYERLMRTLDSRELRDKYEGVGRDGRYWPKPEVMAALDATDQEFRLAVDDFKTVLSEIRKLR